MPNRFQMFLVKQPVLLVFICLHAILCECLRCSSVQCEGQQEKEEAGQKEEEKDRDPNGHSAINGRTEQADWGSIWEPLQLNCFVLWGPFGSLGCSQLIRNSSVSDAPSRRRLRFWRTSRLRCRVFVQLSLCLSASPLQTLTTPPNPGFRRVQPFSESLRKFRQRARDERSKLRGIEVVFPCGPVLDAMCLELWAQASG